MIFFTDKARCVMLSLEANSYTIIKQLAIPITNQKFDFKNNSYVLDLNKAIKTHSNTPVIYYQIGLAEPLTLYKNGSKSSLILKTILDNKDLEELNSRAFNRIYWVIIGGLIIALLILGLWSIYQMGESEKRILELTLQIANMTRNNGGIIIP